MTPIDPIVKHFKYSDRKQRYGLDKPIFIVAAITLAILFVSIYFASVSDWMDGALNTFEQESSEVSPNT
jgi:hypothetical protein